MSNVLERSEEWIDEHKEVCYLQCSLACTEAIITDLVAEVKRLQNEDNALTIFALMEDKRKLELEVRRLEKEKDNHVNAFMASTEKTATRIVELESQLSCYQSKYNNLLAVLHRDGGQYLNEHGEQKASEDGITKVLTAYQDNDLYREGVEVEGISFIGACHNSITFNKSEKAKLYPFDVGQRVKVLVMPVKEGEV